MSELMVLLQALLLIAGWLLFLRAQTELRAQAARQSLTGELEELRQTIDALLQKLAEDAARAEARLEARLRELERYTQYAPLACEPAAGNADACLTETQPTPPAPFADAVDATPNTTAETLTPDSGYNSTGSATSLYGAVRMLAAQGLTVAEIARQTGYAAGEVELILNLTRHRTEENE
ncbi:MAG: hypothetical protein K6U77_04305 [Armatimonadetes bacterium]|nr:hypothetical protein [Armatimonadota bacterium]